MATASQEVRYLAEALVTEVNATYSRIVCEAWGMTLRAAKHGKPAAQKTARQIADGMERAARIVLEAAYTEEDMSTEEARNARLKRDRARYEEAWRADDADRANY